MEATPSCPFCLFSGDWDGGVTFVCWWPYSFSLEWSCMFKSREVMLVPDNIGILCRLWDYGDYEVKSVICWFSTVIELLAIREKAWDIDLFEVELCCLKSVFTCYCRFAIIALRWVNSICEVRSVSVRFSDVAWQATPVFFWSSMTSEKVAPLFAVSWLILTTVHLLSDS